MVGRPTRATNRNLHILCVQVINYIIPVLFCQMEPLPDELREPIPTAPAQGALGIPYLKAETS